MVSFKKKFSKETKVLSAHRLPEESNQFIEERQKEFAERFINKFYFDSKVTNIILKKHLRNLLNTIQYRSDKLSASLIKKCEEKEINTEIFLFASSKLDDNFKTLNDLLNSLSVSHNNTLQILESKITILEINLLCLRKFNLYESLKYYYFENISKSHGYEMTLKQINSLESIIESFNSIRKIETLTSDLKISI